MDYKLTNIATVISMTRYNPFHWKMIVSAIQLYLDLQRGKQIIYFKSWSIILLLLISMNFLVKDAKFTLNSPLKIGMFCCLKKTDLCMRHFLKSTLDAKILLT